MLPEGWREVRFSEVTEFSAFGPRFSADLYDAAGNVGVIRTTDINANGNIDYTNVPLARIPESLFSHILKDGDLLITRSGTCGIVSIFKEQTIPMIAGAFLIRFKIKDVFNNEYIARILMHPLLQKEIRKISSGGVQKNISGTNIGKLKLLLPPFPEQEKIAAVLSTWDKAISTTDALLANSRQQKKALMQQLLTGKRRLPGFTGEWLSRHLSEIGTTYTGITGKSKEDFGKGKFFIPYTNIFNNASVDINYLEKVDILDGECQNVVQYGDILLTTSSETPDEVGMSSVVLDKIENIYLNSFCFGFRLHNFCELSPIYAKFLFRGEIFRKNVIVLAQGATRYNLPKKQFLNINISFPPLDEQRAIAAVLDAADREIVLLEQKAARLREEKKALMQQLLTGKRRVRL